MSIESTAGGRQSDQTDQIPGFSVAWPDSGTNQVSVGYWLEPHHSKLFVIIRTQRSMPSLL